MTGTPDFIVVGAGSAGCAVAAGLVANGAGSVTIVEAGPKDASPVVRTPLGLVWMIGRPGRDWCFRSAPQKALGGRRIAIPRGRVVGGSGSINSMVWFRGRQDDFDVWNVTGWDWKDVEPAFEAVEDRVRPARLTGAHPLTEALHSMFRQNATEPPDPERESAGVFRFNLHKGRRWSAADAFLHPLGEAVDLVTGVEVDRIVLKAGAAHSVIFADGASLCANKGIILSAGAICSPAILMRSGLGPAADLARAGVDVVEDRQEIGENLHDHPAVGLHFAGPGSGYGLTLSQAAAWAVSPLRHAFAGTGRLASPTVEGGAFFNAGGLDAAPDVQSHFIPFMLGWKGRRFTTGAGYFADVCVCRPRSRGRLRLNTAAPGEMADIDPGLLTAPSDADTLVAGITRLRSLLQDTEFGPRRASEVFPGPGTHSQDALQAHVKARVGTAYHPVGTLRMGDDADAPVNARLSVRGIDRLWVADASVMPSITSANTNAPSMMIGHRAGQFISEDAA